jgi:hypothetical protein
MAVVLVEQASNLRLLGHCLASLVAREEIKGTKMDEGKRINDGAKQSEGR